MADTILRADQKSALILEATTPDRVELPIYKITQSTPMNYKEYTKVPCDNGIPLGQSLHGQEVVNKVPRVGFLQELLTLYKFKFAGTVPSGVTGASLGNIGLRLVDQLHGTYSVRLHEQPAESLICAFPWMSSSEKAAIMERTQLLDPVTFSPVTGDLLTDTVYCTFIPTLAPYNVSVRNNWNVGILEPIIVRTTFGSARNIGLPTGVTFVGAVTDGSSCDIYTRAVNYDPESMAKLELANFGGMGGEDMPYFSYNAEIQVQPLGITSTAITSAIVPLTTATANYAMAVYLRPAQAPVSILNPAFLPISVVDVRLGNKSYIQDIPVKVLTYGIDKTTGGSTNLVRSGTNGDTVLWEAPSRKPVMLSWCERYSERRGFSGGIAFAGVINPQLVLKFASVNPTLWEVVVVSYFYQILLMNGSSGRVYSSISA